MSAITEWLHDLGLVEYADVFEVAACIGREFDYELLSYVAPARGAQLEERLAELVGSGLVFQRGHPPDASYTFKHALVQDAAYESMLKPRRVQIHAGIAQALAKHFPTTVATQPELVAHHFTAAEMVEDAIPYWQQAGELAHRRVALHESIAHLERGIGLAERVKSPASRDRLELDLRAVLGMAWIALQGWAHPEVERNLARALKLEQKLGSSTHAVRILWGLWAHRLCSGRKRESLAFAEQLLAHAERRGDESMRMAGLSASCGSHFFLGEFTEVVRDADSILARYDPVRDRYLAEWLNHDAKTFALAYKASAQWMLGYPDSAVTLAGEALVWSRARRHLFDLAWVLNFLAVFLFHHKCEPGRCAELLDEFERLAHEQRLLFFELVLAPISRALLHLELDQPREAELALRVGIPRWREAGMGSSMPLFKTLQTLSEALMDRFDQAQTTIGEVLEQIGRPGWEERYMLSEVLRIKGWILRKCADTEQAEGCFREAIAIARQQQAKSWELRAATSYAGLLKDQGRRREALDLLKPIYDWFTEGRSTRDHIDAAALLANLQ